MRKELAKQEGLRKKFAATFVRLGKKAGYKGYSEETVLLKDVREVDTNTMVADHMWFTYTKSFQDIKLSEGIRVEFEARVKEYAKGYVNRSYKINQKKKDYKLSHPTKIRLIA